MPFALSRPGMTPGRPSALAAAALRGSAPGFSLIEVFLAMAVLTIGAVFVVPLTRSVMTAVNLSGDARSVSSTVSLAKMRAAAGFTRTRVFVQIGSRTARVERWRTDLSVWEPEGSAVSLSPAASFGVAGNTTPPPNTQGAIGQAPACLDAGGSAIAGSSCIEFNSRGVPIDASGSPYAGGAFYLTDGTVAFGVTVSAGGMIRLWRANAGSNAWSLF